MASRQGVQEVVMLFDSSGSRLDLEMRFGQFNSLLAQKGTLEGRRGSAVKAVYAQVSAGLAVHAAVFFQFKVSEQGYVDPAFNLPLAYMADNAGEGPDLGNGAIRVACRSQCPVPWHAINMWEPAGENKQHAAMLVQKALWRNRLGLKVVPVSKRADGQAKVGGRRRDGAASAVQMVRTVNGSTSVSAPVEPVADGGRDTPTRTVANTLSTMLSSKSPKRSMEEKLTATFGEAGRVSADQSARRHREHLGQVAAQFRAEMERQQQGYMEQIKSFREEIRQLKATLRHEQKRAQRLQQLLRGDV